MTSILHGKLFFVKSSTVFGCECKLPGIASYILLSVLSWTVTEKAGIEVSLLLLYLQAG